MLKLPYNDFEVILVDINTRAPDYPKNLSHYQLVYEIDRDEKYNPGTCYGITTGKDGETIQHSCAVTSWNAPSSLNEKTAFILNDVCFIGVSDNIIALELPKLKLKWQTKVDWATCFEVYNLPQYQSIISHGESDITRLKYDGEIIWQTNGKDIFTGSFEILGNAIRAVDFNNEVYNIDLFTGKIDIIG